MERSELTSGMTLDELIGQLFVVGFNGVSPSPEIVDLIQNHHVGGIILFGRNVRNAEQLLALTGELQAIAKAAGHQHPLLISTDQENGVVRRLGPGTTIFPGAMGLGAIGSEQMAHDVAFATGRELRALGVNMNLAPVADVNNNPDNPVIGVRSFGADPELVARLAAAAVRGYGEAGVMTSLKHFPGHGDTSVDSHLDLPVVPHSAERLEQVELPPFKAGIAAGVDSVMLAHVYFPALMPAEKLPATISPVIIEGLLRETLGFEGVIVSDCLEMRAISDTVGTERGAVMALRAGIDVVLISHTYGPQRRAVEAVRSAISGGDLAAERVRQAAERVLRLKSRYLSWEVSAPVVPEWVGGSAHQQLSAAACDALVTLVRNDDGLLPLRPRPPERLLVLYPDRASLTLAADTRYPERFLAETVRRRHPGVDAMSFPLSPSDEEREDIMSRAKRVDLILMATMNAHLRPEQAELMKLLLRSGKRVIGIAARNPYDLLAFPHLDTYVAAYEYTPSAMEAAVRLLFGEIQPRGHLPVSLPGLYERGEGMTSFHDQ